jgi:hypothetical protein
MSHKRLKTVIVTSTLILCLVLGGVFLCNCHLATEDSSRAGDTYPGYRVISDESPYYKEIMAIARTWKDAVLSKDFNALISLADPESKNWLEVQLNDETSELYRILYDDQWNHQKGERSVYEILKNAKRLKIVIVKSFPGGVWERFGYTTELYFFDKKKLVLEFPLSAKDEELLRKDIWLLWISRDEGQWYVSFNLFEEKEENYLPPKERSGS